MSIELRQAAQQALKALEAINDEMTVGERYTNAGQYLLDALGPLRAALFQHPAQATQTAEVTDAAIDAATHHIYHNGRPTSKEYRVGIARAILALRPERVQMTEDQVWNNDAIMSANGTARFKLDALLRIARAVEAHHGITTQAKKETP